MTMTDPIADMLTRLRNANIAFHDDVAMPSSKLKEAVAGILEREGYITGYSVDDEPGRPGRRLTVKMKYTSDRRRTISGLKRVSRPGQRNYVDHAHLPKVLGGMGTAIVSTSQGVMTGHDARRAGVGGEVVAEVW